nr:hypothetical protein [Tanacetum cinerariifolium]
ESRRLILVLILLSLRNVSILFAMITMMTMMMRYYSFISQIPPSISITPILPTMEPEDSLIMEDEDLCTIIEKELDEFIKYSVEDLVPILRTRENSLLAIDEPIFLVTPHPVSKLVSLEEVENFDPSLPLIRLGMITRVADIPSLELNEDECFDPGGGKIEANIPSDFEDDYHDS